MSATTTDNDAKATGNAGPTIHDDALAALRQNVYAPVFFDKLASLGFTPADEREAGLFLGLAARLNALEVRDGTKQAASRAGWLENVAAGLDHELGREHLEPEADIKAAADRLSGLPYYRDAALLVHDALSGYVAE